MSERSFGIGIDLGTSTSAVSRVDISSGTYQFLEAQELSGRREIPSVAYVNPDGRIDFGEAAEIGHFRRGEANRIITNVKLLLRENQPLEFPGLSKPIPPREIIRGLLAHLKKCFEDTAQMPCTRAVITVPAHEEFDIDYRSGLRQAVMGREALFESIDIIPEPDAVLLAIGNLERFSGERVLVFDMGGGTLDVSIREIEMRDGRPFLRQVAVTGSDAAGSQVTRALANALLQRRQEYQGFTYSPLELAQAGQINFLEVDDAKRRLSTLVARGNDSQISCQLLCPSDRDSYSVRFSPVDFEALVKPVAVAAQETVEKALSGAGFVPSDIDRYFVVGGSSRLTQVRQMLKLLFGGRDPNPLQGDFGTVDPTLSVVHGAAIADLERTEGASYPVTVPLLERRMPYAISLLVDGGRAVKVLVPENTPLPFGPKAETFYVQKTGDTHIDFVLMRGDGDPSHCVRLFPRSVALFERAQSGDEIRVSWSVESSGELTLDALDHKDRELTTIQVDSIRGDSDGT